VVVEVELTTAQMLELQAVLVVVHKVTVQPVQVTHLQLLHLRATMVEQVKPILITQVVVAVEPAAQVQATELAELVALVHQLQSQVAQQLAQVN
jgi:hypothetical protein